MGFASVLAVVSDGDATSTVWTIGDWVALALMAGFFGFLGLGAWKLWRIKKQGLLGHEHVVLELGDWFLVWPGWWPDPRASGPGWWAGPLDHDGRLELLPLADARAQMDPKAFLFQVLEERGVRLDETQFEESRGQYGTVVQIEGRGNVQGTDRAYLWYAWIPGPPGQALFLAYRCSVLYGLADGYWLDEVTKRATQDETTRYLADGEKQA